MLMTVHAIIGAALGSLAGSSLPAAVAGFASHAALDLLPHNDAIVSSKYANGAIDLGATASLSALLIARYGARSPEVAGALAAVAPDLENGLSMLGVISSESMLYPTHRKRSRGGIGHGRTSRSRRGQALTLVVGMLALLLCERACSRR